MLDPAAPYKAGRRQSRRRRLEVHEQLVLDRDLGSHHPVSPQELEAIAMLLGTDVAALLADKSQDRT